MLANYNKFEFQNPYQLRMNDFVNEAAIQKVIRGVGFACQSLRSQYVEVLDDMPEGWTIASTLHKIGLGAVAPGPRPPPKPVVYDAETQKKMFSELYARSPSPKRPNTDRLAQTRRASRHPLSHLRLHPRQQALLLQPRHPSRPQTNRRDTLRILRLPDLLPSSTRPPLPPHHALHPPQPNDIPPHHRRCRSLQASL
jgi:hypothetical protein